MRRGRRSGRRRRVALGLVGLATLLTTTTTTTPAGGAVGAAGGERGTVETLAGPGFCLGPARLDPRSTAVSGVAVGPTGTIHVATGPVAEGRVVKVDDLGRTELAAVPDDQGAPPARLAAGDSGRRIASDGAGGVIVATGSRLVRLADRRQEVIAGALPDGEVLDGAGDGGPATAARLRHVLSVATDATGSAFFADEADPREATFRIRFVNRTGAARTFYPGSTFEVRVAPDEIATVVAAPGPPGPPGSPPLLPVTLRGASPALAAAGDRLYVGAGLPSPGSSGAQVAVLNLGGARLAVHGVTVPVGALATVAGGERPLPGDALTEPPGLAADDQGNLYLADRAHHRVVKVDPAGAATGFAGTGVAGFDGNGQPAVKAKLDQPVDVVAGPWGRVYLSDRGNGQVRFVDSDGLIQAAPGNGAGLRWECDPANGAAGASRDPPRPGGPSGVVVDGSGNVYVAASSLAQVKRISPEGRLTTVAGTRQGLTYCGPPRDCSDNGDGRTATDARLVRPSALALRGEGLYVFDSGDARVRLVNLGSRPLTAQGVTVKPGAIATVAGDGRHGSGGDGGPARAAPLLGFGSLAADSKGSLFLADATRIRQIDRDGMITTLVPPGSASDRDRCCLFASGVAVDAADNLIVADPAAGQVWLMNRTSSIFAWYGLSAAPGAIVPILARAGPAAPVSPTEVTVGNEGDLLVVGENAVQRIDRGGAVRTIAGAGGLGFNGDGLKARLTTLNSPSDVAIDRCGNILVADQLNDRVRRINVAACAPERPARPSDRAPVYPLAFLGALAVAAGVALRHVLARRDPGRRRPLVGRR